MKDYSKIMPSLLKELNGVENIEAVTHCVSRLRLVLKNYDNIKTENIEKIEYVKGVFKVNGQLHIIFGPNVKEVYDQFISFSGLENKQTTTQNIKQIGVAKQKFTKRMMNHLSEIFIPLIPVLVAGGLILGLRNILETEWTPGVSAIAKSSFCKGLDNFLWIPACAVFWFLPVFICWSVFKKMKGSQVIGILLGLSLLVSMPTLYDLNDAITGGSSASGESTQKVGWWLITDFFTKGSTDFQFEGWGSYPIKVGYTSQVIPAIGVAFLGIYTERLLLKYVKPVLRQIVVPLVTVLFCYTLAMLVIGPVGFVVGTAISIIISMALTNDVSKYIVAPIFGFLYAPLVITGLHHTLNAIMIQETATIGGSLIFPMLALSNICQGAACLMFGILNRKDEKIRQVSYSATVSAWLAVTEPAMYGINLKKSYVFISACIGSAVASLLSIAAGVSSNGIGNGAWLGTITIQTTSAIDGVYTWPGTGWTWFLVSGIVGTGIAMSLTYLFSKFDFDLFDWYKKHFKKNKKIIIKNRNASYFNFGLLGWSKKNTVTINKKNIAKNVNNQKNSYLKEIYSVGSGNVYKLESINDATFKNKIMGNGIVIDCKDGKVFSPINGRIAVIADTKHAYIIKGIDGTLILIHIGVDTVNLKTDKIFTTHLKVGDYVKRGQLICKFKRKEIINAKVEHKVILLVLNESNRHINKMYQNNQINKNNIAFELA